MTTASGRLIEPGQDRSRTVPEQRIVEMLTLLYWPFDIESGTAEAAAREALHSWLPMGLRFERAPDGGRLFDPVEASNFWQVCSAKGDNSFARRFTLAGRRLVSELAQPGILGDPMKGERKFVVDFKRTFNLRFVATGSTLRLRAPLPLAGENLIDLKVEPYAETASEARIKVSPGRIEARLTAAGEGEAILGARISFTCRVQEPKPGSVKIDCPDKALYLSDREGLIVVSDRVRGLAKRLAGVNAPAIEVVRAFWNCIKSSFLNCYLHYDEIDLASPCDWILDAGRFDCQLGAIFLIALCRARGLPARLLGGFLLHRQMPTRHYWAEVWIDGQGWTPFDFMGLGAREEGGPDWRNYFFGRLEYRMTCERFPREFTGSAGLPISPGWSLLQVPKAGGAELVLLRPDGAPVYSDTIHVTG